MKKIVISIVVAIVFFLVVGFILYAQGNRDANREGATQDSSRVPVAATFFPLYDILRTVGGDAIDPILMVPPGTSPHTFEPTPKDVARLEKVPLVFAVGHGVDDWAAETAQNADIFLLEQGITLRPSDEEEHGGIDPHYWLQPSNAGSMAQTIAQELSQLMPERSDYFETRAKNFKNTVTLTEETWRASLATVTIKPIITFHDAFFYFADYFSIEVAATVEEFPGKEPTPQQLAELKSVVEQKEVAALFTEPQLSTAGVDTLAKDLGLRVGVLDEVGGQPGKDSYIKLITTNIESIVNAHQ